MEKEVLKEPNVTEELLAILRSPLAAMVISLQRFCGESWQRFGGSIAKVPLITKRIPSWQSPASTALI